MVYVITLTEIHIYHKIYVLCFLQADGNVLADIHRRSGDQLYGKHDFAGAVAEYCETAGHLEPSYVIRRFLEAQRIHNLTSYLERLHEKVRRKNRRVYKWST